MAVLVTLTGRFVNPDETGALSGGRITFQLVPADIPDKVLNETVIPGPVSVPIVSGNFTVTLRATDDPDLLANVTGELVYKVTRTGQNGSWLIALPAPGPWDWTDLVPEVDSDAAVIAGPAGPPGPPGPDGPPGPPGMAVAAIAPVDTDVLWADTGTSESGLPTSVVVFPYSDEGVTRPDADVVFWIPDPYTVPNPIAGAVGDLVLRSTPDVITSGTGITHLERYTVTEYDDLPAYDPDTVYFVVADP